MNIDKTLIKAATLIEQINFKIPVIKDSAFIFDKSLSAPQTMIHSNSIRLQITLFSPAIDKSFSNKLNAKEKSLK